MNSRLVPVLALLAVLHVSAPLTLSAAPRVPAPACYPVHRVSVDTTGRNTIEPGTTRETVARLMGAPYEEVSPGVWLYWGYHTRDRRVPDEQKCRGMLVLFDGDAVSHLLFVNRAAATILVDKAKSSRVTQIAANL